jgi:hypothetical protein
LRAKPRQAQPGSRRTTAEFLRRALATIAADSPARYDELACHLKGAHGSYRVDDETFTVTVDGREVVVAAGWGTASVSVKVDTTADALLRLVDGTVCLEELLDCEKLVIRANPDALLNLSAAVRVSSSAAVDSGKLQQHFDQYRIWVLRRGSRRGSADSPSAARGRK